MEDKSRRTQKNKIVLEESELNGGKMEEKLKKNKRLNWEAGSGSRWNVKD